MASDIDRAVERLLALHHKAADARVKLLNTHHAGLGVSQQDIEAKQDAEADLAAAIRAELEERAD